MSGDTKIETQQHDLRAVESYGKKSTDAQHQLEDAINAEQAEKNMSLLYALKTYRKAVGWSIAISLTLVMEGFQTSLLGTALGLPVFRQKYGHWVNEKSGYQLTAQWQTVLGMGGTFGNLIGILIASWCQDRWGYRRTIQAGLIMITGFIFVVFFAPNVQVLFVGEILCGLPWGAFSSAAVAYASEITPIALRGYLTTYVNLCWIMGQMISSGVLMSMQARTDQWAYRIPFALQWMWPIPLFILISMAPESPWFYVRAGRLEEAERSIRRLAKDNEKLSPQEVIAMMQRTNDHEKEVRAGTSYLDCFKGSNLRRTEIACIAWASTVLAGSSFANHPTYFFEQAGLSNKSSFQINLGMRGLAFMGTLLSWVCMTHLGRRKMFLAGLCIDALALLITGILSFPGKHSMAPRWGQAAMIMLWVFVWDLLVTVTAYAIVGEMSATRLRAKSVGLARNAYNIVGLVGGVLNTYQTSSGKNGWNWKGVAGFFWFGSAVLAFVWAFFRLPETKGRSFRELDILFERGVPARKFATTVVDAADEE